MVFSKYKSSFALIAAVGAVAVTSSAFAGYIPDNGGYVPTITVGSGDSAVVVSLGAANGWAWDANATNADGSLGAYVQAITPSSSIVVAGSKISYSELVDTDPSFTFSYNIENQTDSVQTYTIPRTLLVAPLAAPTQYKGSIGITLSDGDSTGDTANGNAELTSTAWASVYTAKVDGTALFSLLPPDSSASIYTLDVVGDVAGTAIGTAKTPTTGFTLGGPGIANNIGITLTFTLSPHDSVGISSTFVIQPQDGSLVPEPASLSLLGLGAAGLLMKRRR